MTVTVHDGKGADGNADTVVDDATITVSITVTSVDTAQNDPPTGSLIVGYRSIRAGTTVGSPVGSPLTATDPENDTLTYAITGGDTAFFDIDTGTGQLTTKAGSDSPHL